MTENLLDLNITNGLFEDCIALRAKIYVATSTTLGMSYDDDGMILSYNTLRYGEKTHLYLKMFFVAEYKKIYDVYHMIHYNMKLAICIARCCILIIRYARHVSYDIHYKWQLSYDICYTWHLSYNIQYTIYNTLWYIVWECSIWAFAI